LTVTVLDNVPEDPQIVLAWNDLVFQMERPEIFFTQQWALAASRAYLNSFSPLILLVYDSNRLRGLAALATHRESPENAFFLTATTADYCDIVSAPQTRQAVVSAVLEELNKRKVRNLIFASVPAASPTLPAIAAIARSQGFHLHDRPASDCGMIALSNEGQRQAVFHSVAGKEKEKRGLKKLSQTGPIQVTHLRQEEELTNALEPIFVAQTFRFLTTNRVSPLVHPERRFFLTQLATLLSREGWLKISRLEVGGHPIAWNYGFRFSDSWFWYLPTYQVQYERLSPGSCLLRLLTEEACADSTVKRLDLGLGDETYKQRYRNAVTPTRYLQLSSSVPRHWINVSRYQLVAGVTKFPAVETGLRSARDRANKLASRARKTGIVATATHLSTRAKRVLASTDEIAFFEAPNQVPSEDEGFSLTPFGPEQIADAAMHNAESDDEDQQTLQYLMRSARRLKQSQAVGYMLQPAGESAAHFLWVDNYDGFHLAEIDARLASTDPNACIIFDCWTPVAKRGHGYYATAIRLAAASLQKQQKTAWIFSAFKNHPSIQGILKAGFLYRFSMTRNKLLFHSTLSRHQSPSLQK